MKTKIKTIDVTAYEWPDRVNGNSYFAGKITVNFGMNTEKTVNIPFQYGYGDQYKHEAFKALQLHKLIPHQSIGEVYWGYYKDNDIIARHTKRTNCKKAELKRFS